jgi:hypothetical protein
MGEDGEVGRVLIVTMVKMDDNVKNVPSPEEVVGMDTTDEGGVLAMTVVAADVLVEDEEEEGRCSFQKLDEELVDSALTTSFPLSKAAVDDKEAFEDERASQVAALRFGAGLSPPPSAFSP